MYFNRLLIVLVVTMMFASVYGYVGRQMVVDSGGGDRQNLHGTAEYKIDINSATIDELTLLPGIGPAIASRIIDYRESKGWYKTVEQLDDVKGIGQVTLKKIAPHVIVGDLD